MSDRVEFLTRGLLIGVGGAALMDAGALFLGRAFNLHGLDCAMLGRWIGHIPRRRFFWPPSVIRIGTVLTVSGESLQRSNPG